MCFGGPPPAQTHVERVVCSNLRGCPFFGPRVRFLGMPTDNRLPKPPECCLLGALMAIGCLHEVYLCILNQIHACKPPRPATDLV